MQIIDSLEVNKRGPYGGGVGHVSFTGRYGREGERGALSFTGGTGSEERTGGMFWNLTGE